MSQPQFQQQPPQQVVYVQQPYVPPARSARGVWYWLFVGWWWAPTKWVGRVSLWVLLLPVGVWRSFANYSKKKELRQRRGYQQAQR